MGNVVRVGRQLRYVHIDHLLQTECENSEEAYEEVAPDEPIVPVMAPRPSSSTSPQQSVVTSVPDHVPDSVPVFPDPIRESVPELDPSSLTPHRSVPAPRSMPENAELRYPARERKAPDKLNL